ncbi:MAG: hypothetical protein HF973_17445 [Chloroflexi bacterium]|nr:hypothetical protein [Chloroflexota bacterium]
MAAAGGWWLAACTSRQQPAACGLPRYDDADDTGLGALEKKTAVLWDIPPEKEAEFRKWYGRHYPGAKIILAHQDFVGSRKNLTRISRISTKSEQTFVEIRVIRVKNSVNPLDSQRAIIFRK